jgi:mannose-6-phosphate isomerase-like protein (cupin superfamily)
VTYRELHLDDIESIRDGRVKPLRTELGITAFGINHITFAPHTGGSLHDESASGQEELYIVLAGGGSLHIEGDEVDLRPGSCVMVKPGTMRQVRAGADGLTYVCVGATPGRGYVPS